MGLLTGALLALWPSGEATRPKLGGTLDKARATLAKALDDAKDAIDLAYLETLPDTATNLDAWETALGLPVVASLTTAQRTARVSAFAKDHGERAAMGGGTLQSILQACGFPVKVYGWPDFGTPTIETLFGTGGAGYLLKNKRLDFSPNWLCLAGQTEMISGEVEALCGYFETYIGTQETVPLSELRVVDAGQPSGYRYPHLVVIGGAAWGTPASVPSARRAELETLVLRRSSGAAWHGFHVTYT